MSVYHTTGRISEAMWSKIDLLLSTAGLRNSKCFVALISRKALDRVRDENDSHVWDNVLLEYETALQVGIPLFCFSV